MRLQSGQLGGQSAEIVEDGALGGAAEDDVQLGDGDGDADAGEHAVHDGGADGEGGARHAQTAETQLGESGEDGDGACRPPAVALDEVGGDHGQAGRGAADLERRTADPPGDDPADGGGDETGLEGCAGGEGDAEGQRQGDQEDRDRGGHIRARDAEAAVRGRRGAVGRVDALGARRVVGAGGGAGGHGSRLLRGSAVAEHVVPRLGWGRSRPWVTACSGGMKINAQ